MLVFAGFFLGLVFFLAGLSGAISRVQTGRRWRRLEQRGANVNAEVLSRVPAEAGDGCTVTTRWEWKESFYTRRFTVPQKWWDKHGGTMIQVRIDSNKPELGELALTARSPVLTLVVAGIWLAMAVVGLLFLFRSVTIGCDQSQFDLIEPVCESVRAYT